MAYARMGDDSDVYLYYDVHGYFSLSFNHPSVTETVVTKFAALRSVKEFLLLIKKQLGVKVPRHCMHRIDVELGLKPRVLELKNNETPTRLVRRILRHYCKNPDTILLYTNKRTFGHTVKTYSGMIDNANACLIDLHRLLMQKGVQFRVVPYTTPEEYPGCGTGSFIVYIIEE